MLKALLTFSLLLLGASHAGATSELSKAKREELLCALSRTLPAQGTSQAKTERLALQDCISATQGSAAYVLRAQRIDPESAQANEIVQRVRLEARPLLQTLTRRCKLQGALTAEVCLQKQLPSLSGSAD